MGGVIRPQLATEQADLVPNEDLDAVVELALSAINDLATGTRLDSPILSPQIYLSAYGLLAALAERLSASHARTLLEMLADLFGESCAAVHQSACG